MPGKILCVIRSDHPRLALAIDKAVFGAHVHRGACTPLHHLSLMERRKLTPQGSAALQVLGKCTLATANARDQLQTTLPGRSEHLVRRNVIRCNSHVQLYDPRRSSLQMLLPRQAIRDATDFCHLLGEWSRSTTGGHPLHPNPSSEGGEAACQPAACSLLHARHKGPTNCHTVVFSPCGPWTTVDPSIRLQTLLIQ